MKLGETDPTRRRIGPLKAVDENGDPVVDFSAAGAKEISVNDGDFVAAAGTVVVIGGGYVYYQATAPDASVLGFVTVKLAGVCVESTLREEVETSPQGIPVGTEDPDDLHVGPLHAVDGNGDPLLGEDFAGAGEIEVSLNGAAWTAPAGAIVELSGGYYDYAPDPSEAVGVGWLAVKIAGVCQEFVFRSEIVEPSSGGTGDTTEPSITVVSPTPGVEPGQPGGFPRNLAAAMATPIVLRVEDLAPGLNYFIIVARFYVDAESPNPTEEVVFRRGRFRGMYVKGSSYTSTADGFELTVRRYGGWPKTVIGSVTSKPFIVFAVDALDADGNLAA